jgi:hypothetical protein
MCAARLGCGTNHRRYGLNQATEWKIRAILLDVSEGLNSTATSTVYKINLAENPRVCITQLTAQKICCCLDDVEVIAKIVLDGSQKRADTGKTLQVTYGRLSLTHSLLLGSITVARGGTHRILNDRRRSGLEQATRGTISNHNMRIGSAFRRGSNCGHTFHPREQHRPTHKEQALYTRQSHF